MKTATRLKKLLALLAGAGMLIATTGCDVPPNVARSAVSQVASQSIGYFFRLLPDDLDEFGKG